MTLIRKFVAAAGIAGALLIPFAVTTATPAAAECQPEPVGGGDGTQCSNECEESSYMWRKIASKLPGDTTIGDIWLCTQ